MKVWYHVYGLYVVANRAIDGLLTAVDHPACPDVTLSIDDAPRSDFAGDLTYESPFRDVHGQPCLRAWRTGHRFRLSYSGATEFLISTDAGLVSARWTGGRSPDEISYYLLGPVLGLLLRCRGVLCLHACAIRLGSHAIAITGPIASGKSTIAAAFASSGNPVISEDLVPLRESSGVFWVSPGYSRVRLWPDSVASLFGSPEALPRLMPDWEKRYLELTGSNAFCPETTPLTAVYILEERCCSPGAPRITEVPPREKIWALAANTYANYLLDSAMRAQEFQSLGRLVNTVPVRRITPHSDPSRVAALCELIRRDVAT